MADTADVAIVGAGIMGVSTAYHLARLGAGRVIVLERDTVCSGSTALASGGIRHQYANRLGVELTTHSIVTYERFSEEFGATGPPTPPNVRSVPGNPERSSTLLGGPKAAGPLAKTDLILRV